MIKNSKGGRVLAAAVFSLLSACGGGGGGGGGGSSSGGSSSSSSSSGGSSQLSLSLSPTQVAVSASTSDAAPSATVKMELNQASSSTLYVGYNATYNGVATISLENVSDTEEDAIIAFQPPAQLGVGTYTDTLTLAVCYDQQCTQQIGNSPQSVSITYTVTAGGTSGSTATLTSLSPTSTTAGSGAFTLTVNGAGFIASSAVQWNGSARPTTFVSASQVTAQIGAADVASAGNEAVTVSNQAVNGGVSNTLNFTVAAPAVLALSSVSPSTVAAGGQAFTLTAVGSGFAASSVVQWNGSARVTTYVSTTELTAQITAADIASVGTAAVTVNTPGTQGGTTAAQTVTIAAPSIDATSFLINPAHTGAVTFKSASLPLASSWSVNVGGPPSYALIADGKVFVTVNVSGSSQLLALDQASGHTLWGPLVIAGVANAAYDNGKVFVVSDVIGNAALMQAFDAATGLQSWSAALNGQYDFSSAPTAANGIVYTDGAGEGGTLYALSESTGAVLWTQEVNNGDDSTPAVTADGLYLAFPDWTYDFNPLTGNTVWVNAPGGDGGGGGTTVVANGQLYAPNGFGTYDGQLLNAETGNVLGSYVSDNPPAIGSSIGYFLQSGTLRGVTLSSNTVQWSFAGDGTLVTSPLLVNQYVFVGSSSGNLYGLNAATGQQVWNMKLGAAIPNGAGWGAGMQLSGLAAGDGLLVVPAGNTVTAYVLSSNP